MDPLTALSLAATIFQFLDFSTKILSDSKDLYKTANGVVLKSNENLDLVIAHLDKVKSKLYTPNNVGQGNRDGELERTLHGLCKECQQLAEELLGHLRPLKQDGRSRRWRSLRQALKAVWTKGELDSLNRKLSILREEAQMRISREISEALSIQQSERFQELDRSTQAIVKALTDQSHTKPEEFQNRTIAIAQLLDRRENEDREHLQRSHQAPIIPPQEGLLETEEVIRANVQRNILELLRFSVMEDRLENIMEAHSTTFEWIFQNSPPEDKWSSFPDWLVRGSGIYWVNGKEASGKSTLMKHIYNSSKTRAHLELWAQPLVLNTAAFFFWNFGTALEKSQSGLLRSLLYTVLVQQPGLLPVVLPHQWALLYSNASGQVLSEDTKIEQWSQGELHEAFKRLIAQDLVPLKLFLLVDGLDEYAGDQEDIVNLFNDICYSPNVKAVVSSRPLSPFIDAFSACPSLCLQHLNHGDIRLFVSDRLESDKLFQNLARSEPVGAAELVHEIVTKSDGLFLWVTLVIRSLLSGLRNGDYILNLRRRLELLPPDLQDMYDYMLAEIPAMYQVEASQFFQIILAMREIRNSLANNVEDAELLTLIDLALADGDPEESVSAEIVPWSDSKIQIRCETLRRRLKSRCREFIEIQAPNCQGSAEVDPGSRIQFSHRAAGDYLKHHIRNKLLAYTTNTGFSPFVSLLKSSVQHLKILNKPQSRALLWHFATVALLCAHHFESEQAMSGVYVALLTQLDRTMEHHHLNLLKDDQGRWIEKKYLLKNMIKGDKGWEAKLHATLHWSNFHPTYPQPIEWHNSFLSLAVQFGLSKFLDQSLGQGDRVLKSKKGRPLLDYAMSPLPGVKYNIITPDVVKVLLSHGANPNEKFQKETCWTNALLWQYEHFVLLAGKGFTSLDQAHKLADLRLQILQLMIEYGADAKACCKTGRGELSAGTILTECFKSWAPNGLNALQQLSATQAAKSHMISFKKIAPWTRS